MFWGKKRSNEKLLVQHSANLEAELAYYKMRFNSLEQEYKTVKQTLEAFTSLEKRVYSEKEELITSYQERLKREEELRLQLEKEWQIKIESLEMDKTTQESMLKLYKKNLKDKTEQIEKLKLDYQKQLQAFEESTSKKTIEVQQTTTVETYNVNEDLMLHVSSLEMELISHKDKVQALEEHSKQQLGEIKQLQKILELKNKELEKQDVELDVKSREIEELKLKGMQEAVEAGRDGYSKGVILRQVEDITELKKRLRQFVEEKQMQIPLDHYEYALINYKGANLPSKASSIRVRGYNRYEMEKLLPREVRNKKGCKLWEQIQRDFGYRCALTDNKNYEFEHFIPLQIGHGGAYEGNIIPLHWNYNSGKGVKNPFHWFREQNGISLKRWDDLIGYLAEKHNLSVEDYFEFVNWCFANPRTVEDLRKINAPSLELWKRSKTIIVL